MKIAFFAYIPDGRYSGFCQWRADGDYTKSGHDLDAKTLAENDPLNERETLIDVLDCVNFNDAKRHGNILAGRDPEDSIDAFGDEVLDRA